VCVCVCVCVCERARACSCECMLCDARMHALTREYAHVHTHTYTLLSISLCLSLCLSLTHARAHTHPHTVVNTPVVITVQRPQADGAVCAVGNKEHKQMLIAHAIHRNTCTSLTSFMPYNVAHAEREGGREGEREIAGDQREFDFITLSQARTHQTVSHKIVFHMLFEIKFSLRSSL